MAAPHNRIQHLFGAVGNIDLALTLPARHP
jgi:hypothetical protein